MRREFETHFEIDRPTSIGDEKRFQRLLELLPHIVFEADAKGTLLFTNRHGFELLGYSREELERGVSVLDVIAPEDRKRAAENYKNILEGHELGGSRYQLQTSEGNRIPVMVFSSRVLHNDEATGLRGIIVDLAKIEAADAAREISEVRFQSLFDQSPLATMIYSPDGRVLFGNRASQSLWELGTEAAQIAQQSYRILEDRQLQEAGVMGYIKKGFAGEATRIPAFKYSFIPPNRKEVFGERSRERWLECFIYPVKNNEGQIQEVVLLQHDITQQIELEEQLRQSQKMEAIGRLAGGIAHDFNNMLTAISGYVEMVSSELGGDNPASADLQEIRKAADRAARLTQQLLAFSRRQIVSPRIIKLNRAIDGAKAMLARIIGEDIELIFRPGQQLWNVKMDQGQMDQILINLAVNARDALPEGGQLTLETENVMLKRGQVLSAPEVEGEYVCFMVSDDGVGMDEKTRSRIFEPFFSTKPAGIGTGLGLSTVYGIVTQNQGFIEVSSQEGVGTRFCVYMPRCPETGEDTSQRASEASPGGTETILLVEDDPSVRSLARRILEARGYLVLEASGANQAYQLSSNHEGAISLLLTDVVMPGISGKQLAEMLMEECPSLKVLFMTGYAGNALQKMTEKQTALINKPFSGQELAKSVREVLDREA